MTGVYFLVVRISVVHMWRFETDFHHLENNDV